MLLLSIHPGSGECPISVRVDDLPEQERALVRETLRLIKAMFDRKDTAFIMAAIGMLIGAVGMMLILFNHIPRVNLMQFAAYVPVGGAVAGLLGWLITRLEVDSRHNSDVRLLINLSRHARCNDLIHEYREANPWFARAIKRRFEQVAAAQ